LLIEILKYIINTVKELYLEFKYQTNFSVKNNYKR